MGIVKGLIATMEMFAPIPEKYRSFPEGEEHWRDSAEEITVLMDSRHGLGIPSSRLIDVLGLAMMTAYSDFKDSDLYSSTKYAKINHKIRQIDKIRASVSRLRKFSKSKETESVQSVISAFYRAFSVFEEKALDDDFYEGVINIVGPEWLLTHANSIDADFQNWLRATDDFWSALETARFMLEKTGQINPIKSDTWVGGNFPEIYHDLYGATRGGHQGGDELKGPMYTFVAEAVRATRGKPISAAAIRQSRRRWLKAQDQERPVEL